MTKSELQTATDNCITTTGEALQTLWDNINKGQQKQLAKVPDIQQLLDRYGVSYNV